MNSPLTLFQYIKNGISHYQAWLFRIIVKEIMFLLYRDTPSNFCITNKIGFFSDGCDSRIKLELCSKVITLKKNN